MRLWLSLINRNNKVMDTDTTTESGDTINLEGEGADEMVSVSKKDYDTLNQTLGSLKSQLKDLRKSNAAKIETKETSEKTTLQTDYGLLALLKVNNIEHEDDVALFDRVRAETGKKPEELLRSKYFIAELKEQQEIRATKEAQPKENNRGGSRGGSEAAVWAEKVNQGKATISEVPQELLTEVIALRVKASTVTTPAGSVLDRINQNKSK